MSVAGSQPERRQVRRAAVLCAGLLCSGLAAAAIDCSVSASLVAFGNFDPDGPDLDTDSGTITVNCSVVSAGGGTVGYSIALSPGQSGSYSPRRLQNGSFTLRYNLFTAGTRSVGQVWGDGTNGTNLVGGSITLPGTIGAAQSAEHIVYGRLAGPQTGVAVGVYSDTLVVTINF